MSFNEGNRKIPRNQSAYRRAQTQETQINHIFEGTPVLVTGCIAFCAVYAKTGSLCHWMIHFRVKADTDTNQSLSL